MGRVIKSTFLTLLLFVLLDNGIYFLINMGYQQMKTGPGRYNYFRENSFDIVVLGSSTAKAYYSDVISSETGQRVLNASLDGSSLSYAEALLEFLIVNRQVPRLLILNVDLFEFLDTAWGGDFYANVEKLSPIYGQNNIIDEIIERKSITEKISFLSKSYRFNNLTFSILRKWLEGFQGNYSRGKPSNAEIQLPLSPKIVKAKFSNNAKSDPQKLEQLSRITKRCREKGIRFQLIESPVFYPQRTMIERDKKVENQIKEFAQKNNIHFFVVNQETHPEFQAQALFEDVLHLNHRGGLIFSNIVVEHLKKSQTF